MSKMPVVLVCDDDPVVLTTVKYCLEGKFELFIASEGDDALIVLASHDVDVLVTDQRMPNMDGAELCVRAAEISPRTKQIMMTAYSDFQELRRATNSGRLIGCLEKPLRCEDLCKLIDGAMNSPVFLKPSELKRPDYPTPQPKKPSSLFGSRRPPRDDSALRDKEAQAEVSARDAVTQMRSARADIRTSVFDFADEPTGKFQLG